MHIIPIEEHNNIEMRLRVVGNKQHMERVTEQQHSNSSIIWYVVIIMCIAISSCVIKNSTHLSKLQ